MRLLVLGGTFNPIHLGHLVLAEELAWEFGYDRVVLVPACIPPHKALSVEPGPAVRLDMLKAAVEGESLFLVDGCELERGGVSYSVETLAHVMEAWAPQGKPGFIIGDDLAAGFKDWRNPARICELADLIVARRSGLAFKLDYPHTCAGNMILPVSSTDIRARIASGKPWRRLVPAGAAAYIESHGTYHIA